MIRSKIFDQGLLVMEKKHVPIGGINGISLHGNKSGGSAAESMRDLVTANWKCMTTKTASEWRNRVKVTLNCMLKKVVLTWR